MISVLPRKNGNESMKESPEGSSKQEVTKMLKKHSSEFAASQWNPRSGFPVKPEASHKSYSIISRFDWEVMAGLELKLWELACYCFIFVTGLIGNLVVCLVVLNSGRVFRRVPFNVYLMSLAIVDLTLAVVCLPIYVMSTAKFPHPTGTKGVIVCKTLTGYLVPFGLAGVSIYLLVIISFERYTAVCKPFEAAARRTSKKTAVYVVGAWLIGFATEFPTTIGLKFNESKPTLGNYCSFAWKTEAISKSVYAAVFSLNYVLPAVIFTSNLYRIRKCLAKLDENLKQSFTGKQQGIKVMEKKRRTIRTVFVVSAAFFIFWTPNKVMYFLFQYGGRSDISWNSDFYQAGIILGFFNSCINPFLYAFHSRDFRSHCKKVLRKILGTKTGQKQFEGGGGASVSNGICSYTNTSHSHGRNVIV